MGAPERASGVEGKGVGIDLRGQSPASALETAHDFPIQQEQVASSETHQCHHQDHQGNPAGSRAILVRVSRRLLRFLSRGFRTLVRVPGRLRRGFRGGRFFGGLLFRSGLLVRLLGLIACVFLRSRLAGLELLDLPGRQLCLRGLGVDLQEFFHGCDAAPGSFIFSRAYPILSNASGPLDPFGYFLTTCWYLRTAFS